MFESRYVLGAAVAACLMSATAAHAVPAPPASATVTKSPDAGPYWNVLSTAGAYIYADSFVAPISGSVTSIGVWLEGLLGDTSAQPIRFDVLGSGGGGGPDYSQMLATTGTLTLDVPSSLALFSATTPGSARLVGGDTYWVAADEVGLSGDGFLQVGGHTQNSGGITDNGTFWFTTNSTGATFEGRSQLPEMAFTVSLASVPEPAGWALMLLGLGGVGATMRLARRRNRAAALA